MARSAIRNSFLAAALLFALLAILATLQYRWIGEVRDGERERLRASARASAEAVAGDFDREIGRAIRTFGEGLHSGETAGLAASLATARDRWLADARYPALVSHVDVARRGESGEWSLESPDASGALVPAPWPAGLAAARRRLDAGPGPPPDRPGPGPPPDPMGGPPRMPFVHVLDDPPVVILGTFDSARALLVRLDLSAISVEILPQLVVRHFGSGGNFDVAVLGQGNPRPVLYRSRPGFSPSSGHAPDAEVPLLPLRPGRDFGERGALPPPGLVSARGEAPVHRSGPPPGAWILVASHRAGSLDEAVDATRSRNLAVSGGILLLLGAAVAVLVSSAHRSARLARQQVEFVASLTHELRTPLAAIRSAGQNLSDGVVADAARVRKYGDLIQSEGRRLSSLIEAALAQAGIQARSNDLRGGTASVVEAIEQAIEACRPLAVEHGAQVDAAVPADLPPISGDEPAVRTLVENLLSNAIKYGGDDGRVTVKADADERAVRVAIGDRGPGIPKAELPRIFEPFYRGSRANGSVAGTGLGLALVRRIVDALGGQISVESPAGGGTTFTVILPRAVGRAAVAGPA